MLFKGIYNSKQIIGIVTEAWGLIERCRNKRKKPELTVFSSILAGGRIIRKTTLWIGGRKKEGLGLAVGRINTLFIRISKHSSVFRAWKLKNARM